MQNSFKQRVGNQTTFGLNSQTGNVTNGSFTNVPVGQESVSGVFSRDSPQGTHVPNPHQYNIYDVFGFTGSRSTSYGDGSLETKSGAYGREPDSLFSDSIATLPDPYNKALAGIYDKLRGGIDLSVSLGESAQTIEMFKHVLNPRKLADDILQYAKPNNAARNWRDLFTIPANAWLEFTYGWRPLASDLQGALDNHLYKNLNYASSALRSSAKYDAPTNFTRPSSVFPGKTEKVQGSGLRGTRIQVKTKPTFASNDAAAWTSLNPVSIAWELMPYSFVVDWFYDIGSTLKNFENALLYNNQIDTAITSNLAVYTGTITVAETTTGITSGISFETKDQWSATSKQIQFSRSVGSLGLPHPPSFNTNLSGNRLLSAAALLAQFLEKPTATRRIGPIVNGFGYTKVGNNSSFRP